MDYNEFLVDRIMDDIKLEANFAPPPPVRSVLTLCGEDSLAFHLTCRMPCLWWRMWYWLLLGWVWRLPKEGD